MACRRGVSDPPRAAEARNMKQQTEVSQADVSEEFKQKVAAWEKAGLFDEIVAQIAEAIEKLDKEEVRP